MTAVPLFFIFAIFIADTLGAKFIEPALSFSYKCTTFEKDVYHVVVWTQIKNEEPTNQEGYVRIVMYGGPDAKKLNCPMIYFNNNEKERMTSREKLNIFPKCFDVMVCEHKISTYETNIFVQTNDGKRWKSPSIPKVVNSILVMGDTGTKNDFATCPDGDCTSMYPLYAVQDHARTKKVDLVLHMGDYRYSDVKCKSSDCADHLQNWIVEFFAPLYKLMRVAPLVWIRGNHEMCDSKEAGIGFMMFLYHRIAQNTPSCDLPDPDLFDYPPPWKFTFAKQQFVVLDTNHAQDYPSKDPRKYDNVLKTTNELIGKLPTILITHKPFWGSKGETGDDKLLNWTLQKALANGDSIPKSVKMIMAGHVHAHLMITSKSRPPTLVVGNSGVALNVEWELPANFELNIDSKVFRLFPEPEHGYDIITRDENDPIGWSITSFFVKYVNRKPVWREKLQKFIPPQ